MYPFSYAEIEQDSSANERRRDGEALDVSIEMLKRAREKGAGSLEAVEALYFTNRLWAAFIEDLSNPDNGLAQQVRASLISVGFSVMREVERIRTGASDDFAHLIDISSIVREGLR